MVLEQGQVKEQRLADLGAGDCTSQIDESRISFVYYGPNEIKLTVHTPVGGYLVLSDVYYPGWRATVDGASVEVLRADYILRAIPLLPGEHTIQMVFDPWTWRVGLAVSFVTWLGLGIWANGRIKKRPL